LRSKLNPALETVTLNHINPLDELKMLLAEINDVRSARSLLYWDQRTYMPPGAAAALGRQIATLSCLNHEMFSSPRVGVLLESLQQENFEEDSDEAALVRITKRDRGVAQGVQPASAAQRAGEGAAGTVVERTTENSRKPLLRSGIVLGCRSVLAQIQMLKKANPEQDFAKAWAKQDYKFIGDYGQMTRFHGLKRGFIQAAC
jgi:hypothetical protein